MKVGIDLVSIKKFKNTFLSGGPSMAQRIFSNEELKTFKKEESLAGVYAAKDAFLKAVSDKKYKFNQIEISRNQNGKPILIKPEPFAKKGLTEISISHDGDFVIAICLISPKSK